MQRKREPREPQMQQKPTPGFPCQTCGTKIQMTIEDLLYNMSFRCIACGQEYKKDASASAKALELLQEVHVASRQLDELRRDPLKGR